MVYDVNNNSKSDHTGELSPFVSESKLTLSCQHCIDEYFDFKHDSSFCTFIKQILYYLNPQ